MAQETEGRPAHPGDILFADESPEELREARRPWKILIVDDDQEVHNITRLALEGFTFEGRPLSYLSAYSGAEAMAMIRDNPDTCVILLDVVMESEQSGLSVVQYIREELENHFVRIILRTGYPGQAPERQVIMDYDINDYKHKTELTAQKLFTAVTAALRGYRDLRIIDKNRKGLEQIIDASAGLFKIQALQKFTGGVLTQLTSLLRLGESSLYLQASGLAATHYKGKFMVIAATGRFADCVDSPLERTVPEEVRNHIRRAVDEKDSFFSINAYTGFFSTASGSENIIYLEVFRTLSELDKTLVRIFSNNVAIALDNIALNDEIVQTQKEVIVTLGEVVENRSKETANHVQRVAEGSRLLAEKCGVSREETELLRLAAPMHDVGKIGIPDSILMKPGLLTPDEFEVIKTHTTIGHYILKNSPRRIMQVAATIALEHHERWDGKGYPKGLVKDQTDLLARIVGLIDVFDALSHKRIYKQAWDIEQILDLFAEERGGQFEPRLVDLFMDNIDEFLAINELYPDESGV